MYREYSEGLSIHPCGLLLLRIIAQDDLSHILADCGQGVKDPVAERFADSLVQMFGDEIGWGYGVGGTIGVGHRCCLNALEMSVGPARWGLPWTCCNSWQTAVNQGCPRGWS